MGEAEWLVVSITERQHSVIFQRSCFIHVLNEYSHLVMDFFHRICYVGNAGVYAEKWVSFRGISLIEGVGRWSGSECGVVWCWTEVSILQCQWVVGFLVDCGWGGWVSSVGVPCTHRHEIVQCFRGVSGVSWDSRGLGYQVYQGGFFVIFRLHDGELEIDPPCHRPGLWHKPGIDVKGFSKYSASHNSFVQCPKKYKEEWNDDLLRLGQEPSPPKKKLSSKVSSAHMIFWDTVM